MNNDDHLVKLNITDITPNPKQPRTEFEPVALQELADSIKEHGIIQPLIVEANTDQATAHYPYVLIAGERRLRASQLAGLVEVPCIIRDAIVNDQQRLELALIENVQRADLSVADEARAYQQLHDEYHLSDEQIGLRVGKARSTVANIRRLAELPAPVLDRIGDGEKNLPMRYARSLIPIARIDQQTASDIAISVAVAAEENREMEFDERVGELLDKKGKPLNKAAFDLDWNPKASDLIGTDDYQPLPACTGCEYRLKIDFTEYCARPKCLDAKEGIFAGRELVRVSKALGVSAAAKGEKVEALPSDPKRSYQPAETAKELLATKHASLRLVAGSKGSVHHWENEQITGSKIVRLMTTDPDALRKAAGWKEPTKTAAGGTTSSRDEYAEQRRKHKEAEARIS
jgi:ParB/RepB/Spo0J family partition protein